jgi:hypothetical protein
VRSNVFQGHADFVRSKRSVLFHPVALSAVRYFFRQAGEALEEDASVLDVFPHAGIPTDASSSAGSSPTDDEVFQRCHKEWIKGMSSGEGGEKALTKKLRVAIVAEMTEFYVPLEETKVPDAATNSYGLVDALVQAEKNGPPLLLVEVGLDNNIWWKKYGQASEYLQGLTNFKENPALVAVVTLTDPRKTSELPLKQAKNEEAAAAVAEVTSKRKKEQEPSQRNKMLAPATTQPRPPSPPEVKGPGRPQQTGQTEAEVDQGAEEAGEAAPDAATAPSESFAARIGVFVVAPRPRPAPHRVALLWHGHANSVTLLSEQFGRVLRAARQLPRWIEASNALRESNKYAYLGPNCCKVVKDKVPFVIPLGAFRLSLPFVPFPMMTSLIVINFACRYHPFRMIISCCEHTTTESFTPSGDQMFT